MKELLKTDTCPMNKDIEPTSSMCRKCQKNKGMSGDKIKCDFKK